MSEKLKKLTSAGATTTMPSGNAILSINAQGAVNPVTQQAVTAAALTGIPPECMLDGVFIMYHDNVNNAPRMVKPNKWNALQTSGEVADGVVIVEGGKVLVVAPTECSNEGLLWSSAPMSCDATTTTDRVTAMSDWNGKANTAAIIAASTAEAVTNTGAYAPGFCNLYSHGGLTAGKWWLPSAGELMMIYANLSKINHALSLISGATLLVETWYWSSTKYTNASAWGLFFSMGAFDGYTQAAGKLQVRPVSAFIK